MSFIEDSARNYLKKNLITLFSVFFAEVYVVLVWLK